MTPEDYRRQLEKAADVLEKVDEMMQAEAHMNAAKHMNPSVRGNPLASAVSTVLDDIQRSLSDEGYGEGEGDVTDSWPDDARGQSADSLQ